MLGTLELDNSIQLQRITFTDGKDFTDGKLIINDDIDPDLGGDNVDLASLGLRPSCAHCNSHQCKSNKVFIYI